MAPSAIMSRRRGNTEDHKIKGTTRAARVSVFMKKKISFTELHSSHELRFVKRKKKQHSNFALHDVNSDVIVDAKTFCSALTARVYDTLKTELEVPLKAQSHASWRCSSSTTANRRNKTQ